MANIFFLAGSPRKGGNTDDCVKYAAAKFAADGHTVEVIRVHDVNIERCRGCRACMRLKRCIIDNDDFDGIWEKVKSSDLIILAAPIYWYAPPGAMKDFIDRTHGEFAVGSAVKGVKAALLSVAADEGCWAPHERVMASWLEHYGANQLPGVRILARERGDAMASREAVRRLDEWTEQLKAALV